MKKALLVWINLKYRDPFNGQPTIIEKQAFKNETYYINNYSK